VGSEVLVLDDGDSGDECLEERVDRPVTEDVEDLSESDVRGEHGESISIIGLMNL
jgi:hypothetical protein